MEGAPGFPRPSSWLSLPVADVRNSTSLFILLTLKMRFAVRIKVDANVLL